MEQHFINFWGSARPTIGDVTGVITDHALRDWKIASLISVRKIKPIWRLAFLVKQEKPRYFVMLETENDIGVRLNWRRKSGFIDLYCMKRS